MSLQHNIIAMLLKRKNTSFGLTVNKWYKQQISRCGSAWLERYVRDVEAAGSNPVTSIIKILYGYELCARLKEFNRDFLFSGFDKAVEYIAIL